MRGWIVGLTCLVVGGSAASAQAATVVGQAPPTLGTFAMCNANFELVPTSVTTGPSYTVPSPGVITKWQTFGDAADVGKRAALRVYAAPVSAAHLKPIFQSEPRTLAAGLNEFETQFQVAGGESIGIATIEGDQACVYQTTPTDTYLFRNPIAPVGSDLPASTNNGYRMDVAAVVEPDADGDGFGDETQDQCPTDASAQGACPPPPPPTDEITCNGNVATIVGTNDAEVLRGTSGDDVIAALRGDDVVQGRGGNDLVCGGKGQDDVAGGRGDDFLRGGSGRDFCDGGPGRDDAASSCQETTRIP